MLVHKTDLQVKLERPGLGAIKCDINLTLKKIKMKQQ